MYLEVIQIIIMTFIYVPIRPARRDPEADEMDEDE
jgi:hypothetical protein